MKQSLTYYCKTFPIFGFILVLTFFGYEQTSAQVLVEYSIVKTAMFGSYSGEDSLAMVPSAVDAQGCVVMAGSNKITPGQGTNIVVKKYNRKLEELWAVEWNSGSNNDDYALDVLADDSCNIYVTGYAVDSIAPYFQRLVALKYDSTGTLKWQYTLGGLADVPLVFVHGMRLALDGNELYIAGASHLGFFQYQLARYQPVTNYDSCGLTAAMLLVKLNSNGTEDWKVNYQPPGWPSTTAASYPGGIVFANNHIYVCAQMRNDTLNNDLVVYKYTTSGAEVWMRHYSQEISGSYEHPLRMTGDPAGNVYITGLTKSNDSTDYLVVQYEADGTLGWALTYDAPQGGNDWGNDVVYRDNYVYVTGQSAGDVATLKLDISDGTPAWVNRWEGSGGVLNWDDRPYGVVVDDSGTVFVGGYTSPQNLLADTATFFMVQYGADGAQSGHYRYHSGNVSPLFLPGFIYKGIARDTSGYMYMIAAHRDGGLTDPVGWKLLKWGREIDPFNPENPYDSAGIKHYAILTNIENKLDSIVFWKPSTSYYLDECDFDLSISLGSYSIDSSKVDYKLSEALLLKYLLLDTTLSLDSINVCNLRLRDCGASGDSLTIFDNDFNFYDFQVNGSSLSAAEKAALGDIYITYSRSLFNNVETIYSVKAIEKKITESIILSNDEKERLLSASSIARYDFAYWHNADLHKSTKWQGFLASQVQGSEQMYAYWAQTSLIGFYRAQDKVISDSVQAIAYATLMPISDVLVPNLTDDIFMTTEKPMYSCVPFKTNNPEDGDKLNFCCMPPESSQCKKLGAICASSTSASPSSMY
ncbi:MAG: hypothetical protein KF690_04245 [Bacteroidetes bacterium]|nr:hypothetical protein [Bacteroidota bacterium]